jgi:hypothetical protein
MEVGKKAATMGKSRPGSLNKSTTLRVRVVFTVQTSGDVAKAIQII